MPRKVFTAGEILTAANLNDVSDATVMVFDDAAARTTAIPTPVEGMVTYLKDTNAVEKFDGTNFVNVDTGGLIAVKSAVFSGTQTASVTASNNVAVTDLSITHAVADASNKLIISAFFGLAAHSAQFGGVGIAVHDGTSLIGIGNAAGTRTRVGAGGQVTTGGTFPAAVVTMPSITFVHTPGAGSKTYTVRAINIDETTRTLFINRSEDDTDDEFRSRGISALTIQEVSV